METYRNFLSFTFKSALIVSLSSTVGWLLMGLANNALGLSISVLIVAWIGLWTGLIAAAAGFWILFAWKKITQGNIKNPSVTLMSLMAMMLSYAVIELFFSATNAIRWWLLFPILPVIVSAYGMVRLTRRHIS